MGVVICTALKDDKERLACFDKSASALKNAGVPNTPETANTKDIVNNFSPNDYKVADADDVHVAPRKFLNKPIELRGVRCFYADKDDYRCLTRSKLPTVVFSSSIGPSAEKDSLESDCGAIKKLIPPACRKTVRLVPIDYTERLTKRFRQAHYLESSNDRDRLGSNRSVQALVQRA